MSTINLTTGSISKHVSQIALPASIGLFFQTMYNVVDSFYAGQISTLALAALGLSFPVFLLIIAVSGGLSRGSSALIANAIGSGDEQARRDYVVQSLCLGVITSAILGTIGVFVAEPLFRLLGADGTYLSLAMQYMIPIFCGSIFFVLVSLSNAILLANGDSKTLSKVLVVGFFLNLVLDPWFLYGGFGLPAMGVSGIAWATVIIQFGSSIYMLSTVVRRKLIHVSTWRRFLPRLDIFKKIAIQAVPASFNIMSVAIGFFVITFCLKSYGEAAVAAFGVTTRIEQIGLLPTFGLYSAIMAMVGQNNGAKKYGRVLSSIRFCNKLGLAINIATSVLIFIFARSLMSIFTSDPEVIEIGVHYTHIMMLIQWSYVMTSTHLAFLQAIKRPYYGFFESVFRKILLPLLFIFLLAQWTTLGVDGVWFGVAFANVLMTFVTIIYTWRLIGVSIRPAI